MEEITIVFETVEWDPTVGPSPDIAMKSRTGRPVQVSAGGRKVIEGQLKSVEKADPMGKAWFVTLTAARQY